MFLSTTAGVCAQLELMYLWVVSPSITMKAVLASKFYAETDGDRIF